MKSYISGSFKLFRSYSRRARNELFPAALTNLARLDEQRAHAPKIRIGNSDLIWEQSWEDALRQFEKYNPWPSDLQ
jgi:hypothetical protein